MQAKPDQAIFIAQLEAVLGAALHWGVLHLSPEQRAVLTNWRFEENQVRGTPGKIVIEGKDPNEPAFDLRTCTIKRNHYLALADLIVQLVNEELAR